MCAAKSPKLNFRGWGASQFCSQARNWSFEARQETGGRRKKERGRRKEEEGRSQKKYFYKYEMLPRGCRLILADRSTQNSPIAQN
ncbi:hypothetical protein QUB05_11715 [Microcoleus sp. F10-C6]|uniref:hypothetical protein n=1 Tax=unclassified Microcoleus TaxID=2642155 RepID=UPI002FD5F6BA